MSHRDLKVCNFYVDRQFVYIQNSQLNVGYGLLIIKSVFCLNFLDLKFLGKSH